MAEQPLLDTVRAVQERLDKIATAPWVRTASFSVEDVSALLDAHNEQRAALERIEQLAEGWRVGAAPGIEAAYTDAVRLIREMRDEARKARGEPGS